MLNNKTIETITRNLIEWSMEFSLWSSRRLEISEEIKDFISQAGTEQWFMSVDFDNPLENFFQSHAARLWQIAALEEFFVSDFGENGKANVIDEYLRERGEYESASGQAWLKGLRHSNISLFEVIGIKRGKTITLRDMIHKNTTITVHEYLASKSIAIWDCVAARIVCVNEKLYLAGTVLPIERRFANSTIDLVDNALKIARRDIQKENRNRRRNNSDVLPVDEAALFGNLNLTAIFLNTWIIQNIINDQGPSPTLLNSDGEKMNPSEVRFRIVGPLEDVIEKLYETAGFDQCEDVHKWAWFGTGTPTQRTANRGKIDLDAEVYPESVEGDYQVTKLGNITIDGISLLLDTNSEERARRGASYLSVCMGDLLGHRSRIHRSNKPIQVHTSEDSTNVNIFVPPHLKTKDIHDYLDHHYRVIIDRPSVNLGNKTPRKAAKSTKWRKETIDWLKQLENSEYRRYLNSNHKLYDTAWIWEELNLKRMV